MENCATGTEVANCNNPIGKEHTPFTPTATEMRPPMKLHPSHRRFASIRALAALASVALLAAATSRLNAQMSGQMGGARPATAMPSPPATASVTLSGVTITIHYNSPQMRGRKIMGGLVPYGKVWRTGANPATTLITSAPLKFGTLLVPAGTHTLFTLPSAEVWQLIVNNQTGQWGLTYNQSMDLGRIPMQARPMSSAQEGMSLSFENTTATSTELHMRWETTDRYVTITVP